MLWGLKGEGRQEKKERKKEEDQEEGRKGETERERRKDGSGGRRTEAGWKEEARKSGEPGRARAHGSVTQASRIRCHRRGGTKGAARRRAVSKQAASHPPRPATTQPHTRARRGHVLPKPTLQTHSSTWVPHVSHGTPQKRKRS